MIKKLMNSKNVSRINATSGQNETPTGPPRSRAQTVCEPGGMGWRSLTIIVKKIIKLTVYVISGNSFDVNL